MSSFREASGHASAARWPTSPFSGLALVAALAVLIHGYHLGADDAAIYVPAIKRVADPGLYPFGAEFFMSHARLSCLCGPWWEIPPGCTHLPVDLVIFAWHVGSIFLLLLAAWSSCALFRKRARAGAAWLCWRPSSAFRWRGRRWPSWTRT